MKFEIQFPNPASHILSTMWLVAPISESVTQNIPITAGIGTGLPKNPLHRTPQLILLGLYGEGGSIRKGSQNVVQSSLVQQTRTFVKNEDSRAPQSYPNIQALLGKKI